MKRKFTKYPSNYVKAYSNLSNNPSMYIDIPQSEPEIELTDDQIRVMISSILAGFSGNQDIINVIRYAIFDKNANIDWQGVYRELLRQRPDLRADRIRYLAQIL